MSDGTIAGDATPAQAEFERLVARDFRRNVIGIVGWEFLWGLGVPFALYWTMLPAYLQELSAPKLLIGLVISFPTLFAPGAILAAYWVPPRKRRLVLQLSYVGALMPWWIYSLASFIMGAAWPRGVHLGAVAFTAAAFMIGVTAMQAIDFEMMTDNTPVRRRGRLMGFRSAAVGVTGLAMGFTAVKLLRAWPFPRNYGLSFFIGTSLFILSCASLSLVRDHVNPSHSNRGTSARPPLRHWLRDSFHSVWNEPNYRILLFFQAIMRLAALGGAFVVAASGDMLGASAHQKAAFTLVLLASLAALGWLIGLLADRYGFRLTGLVIALLLAGAYLLVLATRDLSFWYLAYGAVAVANMSCPAILCNMGAEICPAVQPGRLMALGNSLTLVVVVPGMAICGYVVDRLGSYQPAFVVFVVLGLVSALGFAFLVKEPRTGRLYMIKPMRKP